MKQTTKSTNTFGRKKKRKQQLALARRNVGKGDKFPATPLTNQPAVECEDTSPSQPSTSSETHVTPSTSTEPISTEQPLVTSASKRKLQYNLEDKDHDDLPSNKLPSTIVDLENLKPLLSGLLCPRCLQPSLSLENDREKNCGLAISLTVRCLTCSTDLNSASTSSKCESKIYDMNRRAVAASSATGMGQSGLNNFSEIMDIPVLHHKTYARHMGTISLKCAEFSRQILEKAVQKVRDAYPEQEGPVKDIDVSFDGSWHKRGHTSKSGIALVIEQRTGLIIDFEVLTSFCPVCSTTGARLQSTNILKHERWMAIHQPNCKANYEGPSSGMEKEAALRMWSRSLIKYNMRYVTLISDGDAKTISEIHKLDPYPGVLVQKHECVNHVGKRLGTALRNLVTEKAKMKVTLGGKGYGKLRGDVISQLQSYYTNAIRSNKTVPDMKQAVMAILDHCRSTDENPHHENCPDGTDSWCFFKKAHARGLPPGDHNENIGTPLCKLVADSVRPTFEKMSTEDLLSRCLLQSTQNANESAHSVIWARCPKHLYANRDRLMIAVSLGVAEFDFGSSSTEKFMRSVNLSVGESTKRRGKKRDHMRIAKAEAAVTEKAKRYRQLKAEAKLREEERLLEKHGQFYVSGGGD